MACHEPDASGTITAMRRAPRKSRRTSLTQSAPPCTRSVAGDCRPSVNRDSRVVGNSAPGLQSCGQSSRDRTRRVPDPTRRCIRKTCVVANVPGGTIKRTPSRPAKCTATGTSLTMASRSAAGAANVSVITNAPAGIAGRRPPSSPNTPAGNSNASARKFHCSHWNRPRRAGFWSSWRWKRTGCPYGKPGAIISLVTPAGPGRW